MIDPLLAPLNWISGIVDKLLNEETLDDMQRTFLFKIAREVEAFRNLLFTLPDASAERTRHFLSYEGRSHLANIIGYTEELIDEVESDLSSEQRDLLSEVRSNSEQLVTKFEILVE